MDPSSLTALLVAVVGVAGTLASALLTQRRGDAARREERDLADRQRREELAGQREAVDLAERRAGYTALNIAARQYLTALNDYAHALRRDPAAAEPALAVLDTVRTEYLQRYAEAQMTVPDLVLAEVSRANRVLSGLYGRLMRIGHGMPEPEGELAALTGAVEAGWDQLALLRATMRTDLGISARAADPGR
ncbi:hypothetical protein [Kitasatospora sp. NBC_00458]|uniref:hypothetical protein n=1 Tax=Kitasatospora sp. NBC_00458 TaxID=2903568 RepID=UPI002E19692C